MAPRNTIAFTPARTALFLGGLGLALIIGYSIYAALPLLQGPALTASVNPLTHTVSITGMTERVAFLQIDGAPIDLKEDGSFSIERAYPAGYTSITVTAQDRFGKKITKTLSTLIKT